MPVAAAIKGFLARADGLLRPPPRPLLPGAAPRVPAVPTAFLGACIFAAGLIYGAVMGAFGGDQGPRALQVLYSALKVPLLLLVTFGLTLPSFFVLNTLMGLRGDFGRALRAVMSAQAALAIVLVSLAPLTAFWYVSTFNYQAALLFNTCMFTIASLAGQRVLRRHYQPLVERDPRHRHLLRVWLVAYAFVGIQMAWVLRPFVGDPTGPTTFFRPTAWGNAYVSIFRIFWGLVSWPR